MKAKKKRVNIMLSVDLLEKVDALTNNRSQLVEEVLNKVVQNKEKADFEELLAQGYRDMAEENLRIAKEWNSFDLDWGE